jgi:hypothetical protein
MNAARERLIAVAKEARPQLSALLMICDLILLDERYARGMGEEVATMLDEAAATLTQMAQVLRGRR